MLLSDGYYDARSRSLLLRFGASVDITNLSCSNLKGDSLNALIWKPKKNLLKTKTRS